MLAVHPLPMLPLPQTQVVLAGIELIQTLTLVAARLAGTVPALR
jgi:hypothetical protein